MKRKRKRKNKFIFQKHTMPFSCIEGHCVFNIIGLVITNQSSFFNIDWNQ